MPRPDENCVTEIIIPREQAVFWLDKDGRWRNEAGRFALKKIVRHFHESIARDEGGYFVTQMNNGRLEKVYFPYEDTALFAIDLDIKEPPTIRLNTGKRLPLFPESIFHSSENLYTRHGEEWIKFSERSLLKLAPLIDMQTDPWQLHVGGKSYPILEKTGICR